MNAADVGAVVAVDILGLAGAGQVQRGGRDAVGVAGMRLGVRVAAGYGDRRCGAVCRDDLAGDPRLGRLVPLAGAHRPVEQPGAGRAGDAGCGAGLLQARGGGEGFWRRSWAAMQTAGALVGRDRRGGSAMRFVREIAGRAERVLVFQRTGQWAIPHPDCHRPVPEDVRYLVGRVALCAGWYRLRT